jgi:hypothetical protein
MAGVIDSLINEYRDRLLERDASLRDTYVARWTQIELQMQDIVDALSLEVESIRAHGEAVTPWKVYQLSHYRALAAQAQNEITNFNRFVSGAIEKEQYLAFADGVDLGASEIRTLWKAYGRDLKTFTILDVDRVRSMMGITADGTPFFNLLQESYPDTMTSVAQTLSNATALSWNPKRTAKAIVDDMRGNLQRAMIISRTEQMRANRNAAVEQFRTSGVVTRYRRRASQSFQTCLACLLEDGRIYELREQFSDHPNGRCTAEVELIDVPFQDVPLGRDWLLSLNHEQQKAIMGEERFRAFQEHRVTLDQLSYIHNHPVWGESPQVTPVSQIIG